MSKKSDKKLENNVNNCVLYVKRENGYINLSLDFEEIKGVKVRLVNNSVALAALLYHKVNKI